MTKHPSARSACQRTENPCVDSSILSLGTADRTTEPLTRSAPRRRVDYVAARMALGMSRADAVAATALAEIEGRKFANALKRGELKTTRQVRRAFGVAELLVAGAARVQRAAA